MSHKNNVSNKKGGFWPFGSSSPKNPEDERAKCIEKCNAPKKGMMEGLMGSKTPTPQPVAVSSQEPLVSQETRPVDQSPTAVPPPAAKKGWLWGGKKRSKGSKKTRKNKKRKGTRRRSRK